MSSKRWIWVTIFVGLSLLSAYVSLLGLVAPWTGAPETATLALFGGGVVLTSVGIAGAASATREPGGRPWLGRWLALAVILTAVVVVAYAAG